MRRKSLCGLVLFWALAGTAAAYDVITHAIVTNTVARQTPYLNAEEEGLLHALGLGNDMDDTRFILPSSRGWQFTPVGLMQFGAIQEDEGQRSVHHFFDPQNQGRGLGLFGFARPSPSWALEDDSTRVGQDFSYRDAKELLYAALTTAEYDERTKKLGALFESLGHVVHHIQDMAQPQHVRDDGHCDQFITFIFRFPIAVCPITLQFKPSEYEKRTRNKGDRIPLSGYPVVNYGTFKSPRAFWENPEDSSQGAGIAQFTSNNFVSLGTNYRGDIHQLETDSEYGNPSAQSATVNAMQIETIVGPVGPGQPLRGEIWFISTPIRDQYAGNDTNPFTSSFSIFNSDLTGMGTHPVFTLNRMNYDAANKFLLPRAVGYSEGLVNNFFRGRIEVSLPDEGVYSVIDHAIPLSPGFTKLKMKLKNVTKDGQTPGGAVPQTIGAGTLIATARYAVNPCYRADLSGENVLGEITPSGCGPTTYFSGFRNERISKSVEKPIAELPSDSEVPFEFDFSADPIPINARDLSIQIVFKGQLGSEPDGIAIGYTNTSEPSYFMLLNSTDQFWAEDRYWTPEEIRANPSVRDRLEAWSQDYDREAIENVQFYVGGIPFAGPTTIQPQGYVRIAFLAESGGVTPLQASYQYARISHGFPSSFTYPVVSLENQLIREPGIRSMLGRLRGPIGWYGLTLGKIDLESETDPRIEELSQISDNGPTPIPIAF